MALLGIEKINCSTFSYYFFDIMKVHCDQLEGIY